MQVLLFNSFSKPNVKQRDLGPVIKGQCVSRASSQHQESTPNTFLVDTVNLFSV